MPTKIKIPKGWRKLRGSEVIRKGDEWLDDCGFGRTKCWSVIGEQAKEQCCAIIRKTSPKNHA